MIVIATNNGEEHLPRLLNSIEKYGWYGQRVCIVDTGSTDEEFKKYFCGLKSELNKLNKPYSFQIETTFSFAWGGYDTGAYLRAFQDRGAVEDLFIFLQDSIEIKSEKWFPALTSQFSYADVATWLRFTNRYDSEEQRKWVHDLLGESDYDLGIFAPMFAIRSKDMRKVLKNTNIGKVRVENKMQQQGMERGWAIAFRQTGLTVGSIDMFDIDKLKRDDYEHFKKYFPTRA